ncbi:MAG TPA: signal recognition particle-docking protein FtsY [Candidatus Binatia bacterium]|nr:signal recognition particle-docking protein FtsY [Candidatus Binatia bacterium]
MFKFLKDKLKGALSSFSKKVDEVAEEKVEIPNDDKAAGESNDANARAEVAPDAPELAVVPRTVESSSEETQKSETDVTSKLPENSNDATIPSITIPEKKEGFFSRIKKVFSKKEEAEEIEKKSDLEIDEQKYDEIVVEDQDVVVEGSPLKKVNIHDERAEQELPIVEGMFEPVEPKVEKPKKESKYNPEDFKPEKVKERIKQDVGIELEVPTTKVPETRRKKDADATTSKLQGQGRDDATKLPGKSTTGHPATGTQATQAPEKKGFFTKLREAVTTKKISEQQFDELFWEFEVALLENNVAIEVIEKIKQDLKSALVDKPIPRGNIEGTILATLKQSLAGLFVTPDLDILKLTETKKPLIICFVGINGSGKTTTIAKVAHLLKHHGKEVVLAAADTFRAAAIDQLQLHADKLGVKLIKHDYGADPAAVAFDAIKHAEANKKDVVLIDTAGRLHSNINLVDEMKKIVRVAKPDLVLFIGESITGNDCVEQAKQFNEAVGINGIILSKADIDEKGGAALSVSYVTRKPILYLGVGQEYSDLKKFEPKALLESLGL